MCPVPSKGHLDDVSELCVRRVPAEGSHHGSELLDGDEAVAGVVEKLERFSQLFNLFWRQLGHFSAVIKISGQSYKQFTIVIYKSRVVIWTII